MSLCWAELQQAQDNVSAHSPITRTLKQILLAKFIANGFSSQRGRVALHPWPMDCEGPFAKNVACCILKASINDERVELSRL